jgi:hypothetical protein
MAISRCADIYGYAVAYYGFAVAYYGYAITYYGLAPLPWRPLVQWGCCKIFTNENLE